MSLRRLATLTLASFVVFGGFAEGSFAHSSGQSSGQASGPGKAGDPPSPPLPRVRVERVWPQLSIVRPVQMIFVPDQPNLWYILEQTGRIRLADMNDREITAAPLVADLTDRVNDKSNEEGLLSAVFHPKYPERRELYVYYTANPPRRSVLSRFRVAEDGKSIDPSSEEVILEVAQPFWNHNGGTVLFGPDGMLYLSTGDGGAANDPQNHGQRLDSLLAKVLRIDVDAKPTGDLKYVVPADNPFVGREGVKPEIWAYGLRNVWRMHFDRETGKLWGGDVGQNAWEEIDLIEKGGNYGWKLREGFHRFSGPDSREGMIDPVVDYPRKDGLSVTGGFVYRGNAIPGLKGVYLYADFVSGNTWGIRVDGERPSGPALLFRQRGSMPSSFAEAQDGTLYILSFEGGQNPGQKGAVWRIVGSE